MRMIPHQVRTRQAVGSHGGGWATLHRQIIRSLQDGDRIILCSDGVWSVVQDQEFAEIAWHADMHSLCQDLLDLDKNARPMITL
jgi:serine/threonine protein phosphatase PrpC